LQTHKFNKRNCMKKNAVVTVICSLILVVVGFVTDRSQALAAADRQDNADWTSVPTGGDTMCARGGPYNFWVHKGSSNDLMIYFQEGGACNDAVTCRPRSSDFKDRILPSDHPSKNDGIFNLGNPDNPFKDYSIVYVPYCTGDLQIGNKVATYTNNGTTYTVN